MNRPVAEQIAETVADIRAGRVVHPAGNTAAGLEIGRLSLRLAQQPQPVVECQAIFEQQLSKKEIHLYDDWPSIVPPWEDFLLCYVNSHLNTVVMQVHRTDHDGSEIPADEWRSEEKINWDRVRWIVEATIWIGGYSRTLGKAVPTSGPYHMFRYAIDETGKPENINWIALLNNPQPSDLSGVWSAELVTLGASLNFLNASNIGVAEPTRPRAERRRLDRTGVKVQTIVVRPPGRGRAPRDTAARPISDFETPLTDVRGHFGHYGPKYGKGLLFGRIEGKIWFNGYVRGTGDDSSPRDYRLKPDPIQ